MDTATRYFCYWVLELYINIVTRFFWDPYGAWNTPTAFTSSELCLNKISTHSPLSLDTETRVGEMFLLYLYLNPTQLKLTTWIFFSSLIVLPVALSTTA